MTQYDETQGRQLALKQSDQQRNAIGQVRYSPWWLAVSMSLSLALFIAAVGTAYLISLAWDLPGQIEVLGGMTIQNLFGLGLAFVVGLVAAPIPSAVVWWCWKAFGVERQRLDKEPGLFDAPAAPALKADAPTPEQDDGVELVPGYEVDGVLVAMHVERTAAEAALVAELRRKCLTLVRYGMRRGGWTRSKLAEGPNKLMPGDDWDVASKELQRLNYFTSKPVVGLVPVKDLADIIRRLELAQ